MKNNRDPGGERTNISDAENAVTQQTVGSVAQANLTVLSGAPAFAVSQSGLALAQAQGVLFANMVSNQYQQAVANNVSLSKGVTQLLDPPNSGVIPLDFISLLNFYKTQLKDDAAEFHF